MKKDLIEPRAQLLAVWDSLLRYSVKRKSSSEGLDVWEWQSDDRNSTNSISHAEQLLILLLPTLLTQPPLLALPQIGPDANAELLALSHLNKLGGSGVGHDAACGWSIDDVAALQFRLLVLLDDFFTRWSAEDSTPLFTAGSYISPAEEQEEAAGSAHLVDAASMSVSLCLAAFTVCSAFQRTRQGAGMAADPNVPNPQAMLAEKVLELAHQRLEAALELLIASIAVSRLDLRDDKQAPYRRFLAGTGDEDSDDSDRALRALTRRFGGVAQALANAGIDLEQIGISSGGDAGDFFECGWSWGPNRVGLGLLSAMTDADAVEGAVADRQGPLAAPVPYLYFTVVALDGLVDLWSERVRNLGVLRGRERELVGRLREFWEITSQYWSILATLPRDDRWLIEDVPWRTSDGAESDYFSLLVLSVAIEHLRSGESLGDDVIRLIGVAEELAARGRLTRRVMTNDPAVPLHLPGVSISLELDSGKEAPGGTLGSFTLMGSWRAADFSPLLMKQAARLLAIAPEAESWLRSDQLVSLSWHHLQRRRFSAEGLWDNTLGAWDETGAGAGATGPEATADVAEINRERQPSWYLTERVVEALVSYSAAMRRPLPSAELDSLNEVLVAELQRLTVVRLDGRQVIGGDELEEIKKLLRSDADDRSMSVANALTLLATFSRGLSSPLDHV